MRFLIGFLMVWLGASIARAQAVELTLDDAIAIALDKGYRAQQLANDLTEARWNMAVARRSSKTRVDLSLDSPDFSERVQSISVPNQLPIYNTVGSLTWQGTVQLTQPILMTDGRLSFRSDFQQLRESVFQEQADETERSKRFISTVQVRFQQPLFVPNQLKLNLERAQLQLESEQHTYTRSELDVIYTVTQAFYDLYSRQRRLEIARDALLQQTQSQELAQKKYEAGLIAEVEALQMTVALAQSRNQLLQAEGNATRSADRFKLTVGLALDDSLSIVVDLDLVPFEIDEDLAIAHGLRYRSSLRQRAINRRLAELSLKERRANGAMRGEFAASYERTGFTSAQPEDTSSRDLFDASWEDLRRRPRNLGLQLTLTVPLWDSDLNRARVAVAQTRLDARELDLENERRVVVLDVRNAIAQLREAQSRLDVLKQSEEVARRSYEIDLARFENGNITAQDLTRTRDEVTRAQQAYLDAYIQYQLAVADLKRQTLYDFETGKSLAGE